MDTIDEAIDKISLTYTAEFVPQKFSRNRESKTLSINWRITLSKDGVFISTDYMQGVGHIPTYKYSKYLQRTNEIMVSSIGKYRKSENGMDYPLPKPKLKDILYSLTVDSDVFNYDDFEDWADSYGYNPDSIKDKEVYESCLVMGKQFKKLVNINDMQELFEDY